MVIEIHDVDIPKEIDLSKYRHVFCDLDNTIVTFGSEGILIPHKVTSAINEMDRSVGFSICTARCLEEVKEIGNFLEIRSRSPMIFENGATILAADGSIIQQHFLPETDVNQLIHYLGKYSDIWKKLFVNGKLLDFSSVEKHDHITKIGLQDLTEEMMQEILQKLSEFPTISYFRSKAAHKPSTFTLDITSIQATKQHAVAKVLESVGVNRSEAIGIGDSDNDFPMLEACGLKVAVANAKPLIRDIADVIVPSCNEAGVAVLLPKLGKK